MPEVRRTALWTMDQRIPARPGPDTPEILFAGFRLEPDGVLFRGETQIHLPPKELAALKLLIAHAGQVVTPLELQKNLWGDVHVTGESVPKCVSSLRARLYPEECIQTVYKRGYRLTASIRTRGGTTGKVPPRLAILPLATGYGVPEHLGPVIAEEAMARLSSPESSAVSIIARDSVFTLARRGFPAQLTGEALQADLVLTGTISFVQMQYRLRVEMIRVADGTQIWVEDVLVRRDVIAGVESELVDRLAMRLGSEDAPWLRAWRAENITLAASANEISTNDRGESEGNSRLEAYEMFQRAHHEWQSLQRHRMQDGLQHLLRATELDTSLIGARVDLVNLCVTQCFYGFMSPAMEADIVRRSVDTAPNLAAHSEALLPALGWISFHYDRNLPEALRLMEMTAHLQHDPWITRIRTMLAVSRHRFDEAIDELQSTIEIDPYAPWLHARLAWALHLAGRTNESVDQCRRAISQFPEHEGTNLYGAVILAYNGQAARAISLAQELSERLPYFDLASSVLAYALAIAGRRDEARFMLERLQWLSRERYFLNSFLPAVYVELGDKEAALAELRASNEIRCPWFFQMLSDPRLKALHGNPQFEQMRAMLTAMETEAVHEEEPVS
jgi:DNA-binding winged helix-turn-helix (wHTH) protein/tetratricopeptide (TPR) repeat protein